MRAGGARVLAAMALTFVGVMLGIAGVYVADEKGWLFASPLLALAAMLLLKARPRLVEEFGQEAERWGWEEAADLESARDSCPCCGCPTLPHSRTDRQCLLCEWSDDLPDDPTAPVTLEEATANFAAHLSVFAPDRRPEWSPRPPGLDELELRSQLLDAYRAVHATSPRRRFGESEAARELESRLRHLQHDELREEQPGEEEGERGDGRGGGGH